MPFWLNQTDVPSWWALEAFCPFLRFHYIVLLELGLKKKKQRKKKKIKKTKAKVCPESPSKVSASQDTGPWAHFFFLLWVRTCHSQARLVSRLGPSYLSFPVLWLQRRLLSSASISSSIWEPAEPVSCLAGFLAGTLLLCKCPSYLHLETEGLDSQRTVWKPWPGSSPLVDIIYMKPIKTPWLLERRAGHSLTLLRPPRSRQNISGAVSCLA